MGTAHCHATDKARAWMALAPSDAFMTFSAETSLVRDFTSRLVSAETSAHGRDSVGLGPSALDGSAVRGACSAGLGWLADRPRWGCPADPAEPARPHLFLAGLWLAWCGESP